MQSLTALIMIVSFVGLLIAAPLALVVTLKRLTTKENRSFL